MHTIKLSLIIILALAAAPTVQMQGIRLPSPASPAAQLGTDTAEISSTRH